MEAEGGSQYEAKEGDNAPLPVSEPAPKTLGVSPINAAEPANEKDEVTADSKPELGCYQGAEHKQPFLFQTVENDGFSRFERRTILLGWFGLGIAFVSLLAACVAGFFIYQQWREMNAQTGYLNRAATQARDDSAASAVATAKQLATLQEQLAQQMMALEMDQRPWLKFELGGERPKNADPNTGKERVLATSAGQPIKIEVRVTNVGKTTAERVFGTLQVQYVPKGKKPVLPEKIHRIVFIEGGKPEKGAIPGTAWSEATLYPGEVSQNSFSRSRWGKNGIVEDDPITQAEKTELDNGTAYVLLLGEVWYSDVFGVRHWTKFCEMSNLQLDPSVGKKCVAFGAVDANQANADSTTSR